MSMPSAAAKSKIIFPNSGYLVNKQYSIRVSQENAAEWQVYGVGWFHVIPVAMLVFRNLVMDF